jgi:hypothetical protein
MSKLFRNVPFLTSLEMSPFVWLRRRTRFQRLSTQDKSYVIREVMVAVALAELARYGICSDPFALRRDPGQSSILNEAYKFAELPIVQVRRRPVGHAGLGPMDQIITLAHDRLLR